jgi:tetratricopeptide (TPR) repeat protein
MRPSSRRLSGVAAAVLLAWSLVAGAPAAAESAAHEVAFRRAEIRERSFGDLPKAAELYLQSAREAPDVPARARAELRAAACLARSGKGPKAQEIAERWSQERDLPAELLRLAADVLRGVAESAADPPPTPPPVADPEHVRTLEEELDQARLRLEQAVGQTAGARQEMESLAAELRAKEREIATLRAQLPPPEPETAEEALRLRQQQLERQSREAKAIAAAWTGWAARLHQDGRFGEALEVLRDALARDPENADAKALLTRVVAPLGDREQLHLRIREVLALAREVRGARMLAEAQYLAQQGRHLQERGELEASVAPLERALALTDARLVQDRAPASLRGDVEEMLRRIEAAGIARAPVQPEDEGPLDASWTAALREMLAGAGDEIEQGLALRFHDLDPLLPATSVLLPPAPVTEPPAGWTLSTQGADAAGLIAGWLAGGEASALAAPGASYEVIGSTVVALADQESQTRLQSRINAAALSAAPATLVEIAVLRAAPGAWDARLRARELESRTLPGGARVTVLPSAEVEALLADGGDGAVKTASRATFRAAHLQPFRLLGGGAGRSVTIDVLAVSAGDPGAALQVETSWRPVGRHDAAFLSQRALAGAPPAVERPRRGGAARRAAGAHGAARSAAGRAGHERH